MLILRRFITKCQLVRNIFVEECQLLSYGVIFMQCQIISNIFTMLRNFSLVFGVFLHMQRFGGVSNSYSAV